MARICSICERKAIMGYSVSHSQIATKRRMNINLQSKKVDGKRISICTSCIKSINKKKKEVTV
jgi:large subunit ribosomal protein L28